MRMTRNARAAVTHVMARESRRQAVVAALKTTMTAMIWGAASTPVQAVDVAAQAKGSASTVAFMAISQGSAPNRGRSRQSTSTPRHDVGASSRVGARVRARVCPVLHACLRALLFGSVSLFRRSPRQAKF